MSANAKNAATEAATQKLLDEAAKLQAVPEQNSGEKNLTAVVEEAVAADTMIDALKRIEDRLADGVTVSIKVHEDGKVDLDVVDSKVKSLAGKAKGVFQRNKKLVLTTAGLVATSVILKAIARRQAEELEADEVVESSDEISTEA